MTGGSRMRSRRHSGRLFTYFFHAIQSISEPFWKRKWAVLCNCHFGSIKKGFSKQMVLQYKLIPALPWWIPLCYRKIHCMASKTCFTSHLATAYYSPNMSKGSINKHEKSGEWLQSLLNSKILWRWSGLSIFLSLLGLSFCSRCKKKIKNRLVGGCWEILVWTPLVAKYLVSRNYKSG